MLSEATIHTRLTLDPGNLKKVVDRCIPKELIPKEWKCDGNETFSNLEVLLNMTNSRLGIFGSKEALINTVIEFLGVGGCANLLQFASDSVYCTVPRMQYSIKRSTFLYKTDIYSFVHHVTPIPFKIHWQGEMVDRALRSCWRNLEAELRSQMSSHCEMVEMSIIGYRNLAEELNAASRNRFMTAKRLMANLPRVSKLEYNHFLLFWSDWTKFDLPGSEEVYEIVKGFMKKHPVSSNNEAYKMMLAWIGMVIQIFAEFAKKQSMNLPPFHQNVQEKATIRLFACGKDNFVIADELLMSLKSKNMDVSQFEKEVQSMPKLSTFNFKEISGKIKKEDMKNIEFIRMAPATATLNAIPIPSPDGGYCVLASEAFRELLNDMIIAKRVFQTMRFEELEHIKRFFESMGSFFAFNRGVYFLSIDELNSLKIAWEDFYESNLKKDPFNLKDIRRLKRNGFSLEDLHREIEYLNLVECFPQILKDAKSAYLHHESRKARETFNTSDMYSMVYSSQVPSLLVHIPNLARFLHSQKTCHSWAPYVACRLCQMEEKKNTGKISSSGVVDDGSTKEQSAVVGESTEESSEEATKNTDELREENEKGSSTAKDSQKRKRSRRPKKTKGTDQIETSIEPIPAVGVICEQAKVASTSSEESKGVVEKSSAALPEAEDQVLDNVSSEATKQKTKRSKKSKKVEKVEPSDTVPEDSTESTEASIESNSAADQQEAENPGTKNSETCPKCFRSSQFTISANEKLRISKVECKHLKKELAQAELDLEIAKKREMNKDDRIRMLESLLREKETQLLEKQDTIMQLEIEVDRIIHEKSTEIKDLENSISEKEEKIKTLEAGKSSELRFLAPTRTDKHTEQVRNVFSKLLEIKDTLLRENPVGKCQEFGFRLIMKSKSKAIENATRIEMHRYCKEVKTYMEAVDNQLVVIRGNQPVKPEEIPELPEFPALSQEFLKNYKDIVKSEAPRICHSLLKAPEVKPGELADNDCLVCIEEMDCEEETIKCGCCKRRYHTTCAQQWFKTKRTCPACGSGLFDASEFPALA